MQREPTQNDLKELIILSIVLWSMCRKDYCVSDTPDQCGKDEKYYKCSPSCGGTCDTYRLRPVLDCACVPGCWCHEGYVKRRDGKCVLEADCPADETTEDSCRSNEVYKQCGVRVHPLARIAVRTRSALCSAWQDASAKRDS
ncbi:uncharacterized protein TNCV_1466741 [Trichonephila clavipes]|nr:uncharacterized protein TNCV_1466741 [Trichonephila clavipes]